MMTKSDDAGAGAGRLFSCDVTTRRDVTTATRESVPLQYALYRYKYIYTATGPVAVPGRGRAGRRARVRVYCIYNIYIVI